MLFVTDGPQAAREEAPGARGMGLVTWGRGLVLVFGETGRRGGDGL